MKPWLARNLVYRPATWLRGEPVFSKLREYEQTQWWSREQLVDYQEKALERLLRHAVLRSSHYQDIAARTEIDARRMSAADLERFPLLTKMDLVEHGSRIQVPRLPATTSWKTTGGSTGVAVRIRKNRRATAVEQAASWRSYGWYGIKPGDKQARFWGIPQDSRARSWFRAVDLVLNRQRFSAFAFRPEDLRGYFSALRHARPAWAYGYVSMLSEFATFCLDEKLPLAELGIRAVVTTSEVLSESDRHTIHRAFGCPVYNEYGCGEVGAVLYECERNRLHAMMENLLVELKPDPTPDEPDARRLVLTDLHNLATPLIRYDIGDRVVPAGDCKCGRGLTPFRRVFGRAYDMIQAGGRRFHGEFFLYIVETARDRGFPIRQAQFVQTAADHIEVRVVPLQGFGIDTIHFLRSEVERRTNGLLTASVRQVEEIVREPSGKIRLIKSLPQSNQR